MKVIQTITSLILVLFIFSCDKESVNINDLVPSYFLTGMLNEEDPIELEYFEIDDAPKYISSEHTPNMSSYDDYWQEEIGVGFSFDRSWQERIELSFVFKFDKATHPQEYLSNIDGIDQLQELMSQEVWGFNDNDNYNKNTKSVTVSYSKFSTGQPWAAWYNSKIIDGVAYDSLNNTVSDFKIKSVKKYEDFQNGNGLMISGSFNCILFNRENPADSIRLCNMDFQGFAKLIYCKTSACQ